MEVSTVFSDEAFCRASVHVPGDVPVFWGGFASSENRRKSLALTQTAMLGKIGFKRAIEAGQLIDSAQRVATPGRWLCPDHPEV